MLTGKRALITGIASTRSIAYAVAEAFHREGCELALTYLNEKLKSRVDDAAAKFDVPASRVLELDVTKDRSLEALGETLASQWDSLDCMVHSIAFAPREQLEGRFAEVCDREGFRIAHDVSAFSLIALSRVLRPLLSAHGGSIITMSYLGAVRALPSYNVMGLAKASLEAAVRYLALDLGGENIRVNAISAGPIKTLSAAGISNFRKMLSQTGEQSPLGRSVEASEVANTAVFLASPLASGITAETIYVDAGYNAVAMAGLE